MTIHIKNSGSFTTQHRWITLSNGKKQLVANTTPVPVGHTPSHSKDEKKGD